MNTNSTLYFILGHQKHNQIIKTQSEMFTISRYRSDPISKHDDFLSNQGESPLFQCVSETATRGVALGDVLETLRNDVLQNIRCYESGNWGCYSLMVSAQWRLHSREVCLPTWKHVVLCGKLRVPFFFGVDRIHVFHSEFHNLPERKWTQVRRNTKRNRKSYIDTL